MTNIADKIGGNGHDLDTVYAEWNDDRTALVHPVTGVPIRLDIPATSMTAVAIGDSIAARDEGANTAGINGPLTWGVQTIAEMLLGGSLEVNGIYATGGYTVAQVASTHLPTALATDADIVYARCGVNDILAGTAGATVYNAIKTTIIDPILAAGKHCIACTITYSTSMTAAQRGEMVVANNMLRALAGTHKSL